MNILWKDLHDLFDTDDGSLPEIWITNLSADGISTIYTMIRTVATTLPGKPTFWDKRREQASLLGSVANAARLVAENVAEPFHFVAHGMSFGGTPLPDIGVFVFQDQIAFDYRMGSEWDAAVLHTLFALFKQIKQVEPAAHITLEDTVVPTVRQRFERAVDTYLTPSHE